MKDFKQYNSTVKSVEIACEQLAGSYHVSRGDMQALLNAIYDLVDIYNTHGEGALELKEF